MTFIRLLPIFLTLLSSTTTNAHSWIEQMDVISANGSYTGPSGYPRGYVVRSDSAMTVLAPPNGQGRTRIDNTDMVCSKAQAQPNSNTNGWPQLSAVAGDYVAAKYLENGHVTSSQNQVGKAGSGGLVYIYGTTNTANQPILTVTQWTASGALSEGRLLAINTFDDGRCYQINPNSAESQARQKQFPDPIPGQAGSTHEQWCETNFQIPSDAQAGNLVVYWVWQWPTLSERDTNDSGGKDEIYTSCADVNVVGSSSQIKATVQESTDPAQDPQTQAVPNYKERAANVTFPANTAFYGPSNKAATSGNGTMTSGNATMTSVAASTAAPMSTGYGSSAAATPATPAASSVAMSGAASGMSTVYLTVTTTVTASPTEYIAQSAAGSGKVSTVYTTDMVTMTSYYSAGAAKSTVYTTAEVTVTSYYSATPTAPARRIKRQYGRIFGIFE